jgi:hypothetical protein
MNEAVHQQFTCFKKAYNSPGRPPKFSVAIKLGNANKVKPTVKSTQENICLIHSSYPEMCETRCFISTAFQSF